MAQAEHPPQHYQSRIVPPAPAHSAPGPWAIRADVSTPPELIELDALMLQLAALEYLNFALALALVAVAAIAYL